MEVKRDCNGLHAFKLNWAFFKKRKPAIFIDGTFSRMIAPFHVRLLTYY